MPHGWIKLPEEDYPITARSLIYNFGIERQEWNAEENADRLPRVFPIGWRDDDLETNNISSQAMHNYLQANYTTANNWRSGVEILKQIQPLARPTLAPISSVSRDDGSPGFPMTPDYPATSPVYQPGSPVVPLTPDYPATSPVYRSEEHTSELPVTPISRMPSSA